MRHPARPEVLLAMADPPQKAKYVYRILIVVTERTETEPVVTGSGVDEVLQELTACNGRRGFPLKHLWSSLQKFKFHVRWLLHIRPAMTLKYSVFSY